MVPVFLAASFCQQAATMSAYKFTPRAIASPDAPQKSLVCKRARSGCNRLGAKWVQSTWNKPGSRAEKPRTASLKQPACTHKEHHILSTAEASAFAAQFLDRKVQAAGLGKIEEIWSNSQAGGCAPQWGPLWKGATMRTIWIQNTQWSLEHCSSCALSNL